MNWNILATNTFAGVADSDYATGFAPAGFTNLNNVQVGMKAEAVNLYNAWDAQLLSTTQGIATGAKVRARVNYPGTNIAPPLNFTFGQGGLIAALFTASNATGTSWYRGHAYYNATADLTAPSIFIAVSVKNPYGTRAVCSVVVPGNITSLSGKYLESGFVVVSPTQHFVFCRLFDVDGVTLLAETTQLLNVDWVNMAGNAINDVANNRIAGIGNQWGAMKDVSLYSFASVGILQSQEAYIQNISRNGTLNVFATPATGGTGPYTYQWQKNAGAGWTAISGANALTLKQTGVNANTQYRCVATDALGATATSNALTCNPAVCVTLLISGDSIIEGPANGVYASYVYALTKAFSDAGLTLYLFDFAAGSTTTSYQAEAGYKTRFGDWITRTGCDAVMLRTSVNDAFANATSGAIETNLRAGLQAVTVSLGVKLLYLCPIWTGTPSAETLLESYDSKFALLASENIPLIKWQGVGPRTATTSNGSLYDGLHANALGYSRFAPLDKTFILDNLPVPILVGSYTVAGGQSITIQQTTAPSGGTVPLTKEAQYRKAQVDGSYTGAFTSVAFPSASLTLNSLSSGNYQVQIVATDSAGQTATSAVQVVAVDVTPPLLASATMGGTGLVLAIAFDSPTNQASFNPLHWLVKDNGVAATIASGAWANSQTLLITLVGRVYNSEVATLDYTGNSITDAAGNPLGTFANYSIDVSAAPPRPAPTAAEIAAATVALLLTSPPPVGWFANAPSSGGGGGLQLVQGDYKLTSRDSGPDGIIRVFVGDVGKKISLTLISQDGQEIGNLGAVLTTKITKNGAEISTGTATPSPDPTHGNCTYTLQNADAANPGTYRITVARTIGGATDIFGYAILEVRPR
jgi:hypothetical protein